ncbi:MAG: V-type ATP synthase subunit F [Sulfolobales archaeon]
MERGKVLVMGDRYTVNMFNLIGIKGIVVDDRDPKRIREIVQAYIDSGDYAIIYITKDLADLIKDYIERVSMIKKWPIITVIPSRWSETEEYDASAVLRKALGIG